MRLIFAGTPEFARVAAAQLHAAGFDIVLVLTQPDRPAGRGMKLQASPVKQWALAHQIPVAQPRGLRLGGAYAADAAAAHSLIAEARADAMVVAAYGLILPLWALAAPRMGCLNIHASLLPRWRGAAPVHRAIESGDSQTGVTIMQMDAGLDTGDMLLRASVPIGAHDTTDTLVEALAVLGGKLIVQALQAAAAGALCPLPQPVQGVTYAAKIDKREAALDWRLPAKVLERKIRAFTPFPGARGSLKGEVVKLLAAQVHGDVAASARPGEVLAAGAHGVDISTGCGVLRLTRLQKPGGKALAALDFLHGFAIAPGSMLDLPESPLPQLTQLTQLTQLPQA